MWSWERLEEISKTECVKNEELLSKVNEGKNITQKVKKKVKSCVGNAI